jgi:hypothetical protein
MKSLWDEAAVKQLICHRGNSVEEFKKIRKDVRDLSHCPAEIWAEHLQNRILEKCGQINKLKTVSASNVCHCTVIAASLTEFLLIFSVMLTSIQYLRFYSLMQQTCTQTRELFKFFYEEVPKTFMCS